MSVYIIQGNSDPQQAASNTGWSDFTQWVTALGTGYPTLTKLVNEGRADSGITLRSELAKASTTHPATADVKSTTSNLLDALLNAGDEQVTVSNGVIG